MPEFAQNPFEWVGFTNKTRNKISSVEFHGVIKPQDGLILAKEIDALALAGKFQRALDAMDDPLFPYLVEKISHDLVHPEQSYVIYETSPVEVFVTIFDPLKWPDAPTRPLLGLAPMPHYIAPELYASARDILIEKVNTDSRFKIPPLPLERRLI